MSAIQVIFSLWCHWLLFRATSMESSSIDSVLVITADWRLLVAEPQTCRSADEICLSSLRHKRTGVNSLLTPGCKAPLSLPPWDCVWSYLDTSVFFCVWKSEDEEERVLWQTCLLMWESLHVFSCAGPVWIFVYVVVIRVPLWGPSVCVWVSFALGCISIMCVFMCFCVFEGWSAGGEVSLRHSRSFFLSCRLELL